MTRFTEKVVLVASATSGGADDGRSPVELVRDSGGGVLPAFSSDGQWVAFGHTEILPDRITEGYGPSPAAFRRLKAEGAELVITVDCGAAALVIPAPARNSGDR